MNTSKNTTPKQNQWRLVCVFIGFFLVSQYLIAQHSTTHLFHLQSDECLVFQIAASPVLVGKLIVFDFIQHAPENFQIKNDYFLFLTVIQSFSPRAPPVFFI